LGVPLLASSTVSPATASLISPRSCVPDVPSQFHSCKSKSDCADYWEGSIQRQYTRAVFKRSRPTRTSNATVDATFPCTVQRNPESQS